MYARTALGTRKRALLRALGSEVARLHRTGIVHGDLTPYNVFVTPGEPPCFIFLDHDRTRPGFPGRTPLPAVAQPGSVGAI